MNKQTLSNLIALGEGFTTEFKRTGTSNMGREICAFANATGGIILIGVADDGIATGVGNHITSNPKYSPSPVLPNRQSRLI